MNSKQKPNDLSSEFMSALTGYIGQIIRELPPLPFYPTRDYALMLMTHAASRMGPYEPLLQMAIHSPLVLEQGVETVLADLIKSCGRRDQNVPLQ